MKHLVKLIFLLFFAVSLVQCIQDDEFTPNSELEADEQLKSGWTEKEYWATIEGTNIQTNYTVQGHGSVDLVLIHGIAMNNECWPDQIDYFKRKARIININLPYVGDGYAYDYNNLDYSEYSIELLIRSVYAVLEQTKSLHRKVVLVGHSSGYLVAKEFIIRYPGIAKMMINVDGNPWIYPTTEPERSAFLEWLENFFALVRQAPPWFVELNVNSSCPVGISSEEVREYVRKCIYAIPGELVYNLFIIFSNEQLNLPGEWDNTPTLSIHISEPSRKRLEAMHPGITFAVVQEPSGHYVQMDQPEVVNSLIDDFIFKNKGKRNYQHKNPNLNITP